MRTIPVTVQVGTTDYDTDDDGLIEIASLVQLNAVRYDLDGNGAADSLTDWQSILRRLYHRRCGAWAAQSGSAPATS